MQIGFSGQMGLLCVDLLSSLCCITILHLFFLLHDFLLQSKIKLLQCV